MKLIGTYLHRHSNLSLTKTVLEIPHFYRQQMRAADQKYFSSLKNGLFSGENSKYNQQNLLKISQCFTQKQTIVEYCQKK